MSAGDFFNRWSRAKPAGAAPSALSEPPGPAAAAAIDPAPALPPPTLEDVAALGHDADFRRFVQPGVDEAVRRSAMKKLFTDPHFNVMDGLDIYIGDYNTFDPIPAAMLAMLTHAKPLLDPLGHLQQPAMRMLDRLEQIEHVEQLDQLAQQADTPTAAALEASPADGEKTPAPVGTTMEPADQSAAPATDGQETGIPDVKRTGGDTDETLDFTASEPVIETNSRKPATPEDEHTI